MAEHKPRNYLLPGGISRYGRSKMYQRKALYKRKKTPVKKAEAKPERFAEKSVRGDKNGGTRKVATQRRTRYYPTEDTPRPLKNRKVSRPTRLRSSIKPGTVLILLAGVHRSKRVVFLKQLPSGLLLVTGPYVVNGCPLRRVDQAYVIATEACVDISGVKLPEKVDDVYFRREKKARKSKNEGDMFEETKKEYKVSDGRKADQKAVDQSILAAVKKVPQLLFYLRARFTLHYGQYPHAMAF